MKAHPVIAYRLVEEYTKTQCLAVPVFEDAPDKTFGAILTMLKDMKDFEGKKGERTMHYREDAQAPRLLFCGLGKKKELDTRHWKQAVGSAVIAAQGKKVTEMTLVIPEAVTSALGAKFAGQETTIAIELANYSFDEHKEKDTRVKPIENLSLVVADKKQHRPFSQGHGDGLIIADGANTTRRLGNTPSSIMTPTLLAKESGLAFKGIPNTSVKILSKPDMKKLGMGCLLGVAAGSEQPPKFIILEYRGGKKGEKPTVLVGKGITFDSGGISLKPGDLLMDMKFDMLGAATVLGVIKAAARLKLKKNLVGLMPSCENMPSGSSYRPDDILTAMNGKSVLIINTDAEGRLILADALCYAHRYTPKEVIDFATLTGACVVAIGQERSGLFSPVDTLAEKLLLHGKAVGEQLWRLPLGEEFTEAVKTPMADLKNVAGTRYGGASTGAAFLEFFTKDKEGNPAFPWAHVDLSSCYGDAKGTAYICGGANGFGVQTMISYFR